MANKDKKYLRFPLYRRIEHWTMVTSFVILATTGLIQKFNDNAFSRFMFELLQGVETTRIIHRIAAITLVLVTIVHLGDFVYNFYVRRTRLSMLPGRDDVVNAWKLFRYNLGAEEKAPKQGYYTFEEKFEYWALLWGTAVMILTGFILWNPILANKLLPGSWIPAAKAAHGMEAILAVLAVLIWHFYHVLIKHFNKSMYNGYMSEEEMEHYHPAALEEPPFVPPSPDSKEYKQRKRKFEIGYSITAVILLAGLGYLVFGERTAVKVEPPIQDMVNIQAYSPLQPTAIPTQPIGEAADLGASWDGGIGAFIQTECAICHGAGMNMHDLKLTSYQSALEGGDSGPAIRPGAGGVSLIVIWPQRDDHPVHLDPSEVEALRLWIDAGAPEN